MTRNIVYLYSEVMPYAISVMQALVVQGMTVDCIYWDENKKTPFLPSDMSGIKFYKRSGFNKEGIIKFLEKCNPAIIYVSGRMDSLYLYAAENYKSKCFVVSGSDNQWTGTKKQVVASLLSNSIYKRYFSHFWVPGRRQYEYARRMGYSNDKILPNLLTGDSNVFNNAYSETIKYKENAYPHSILYAGRFAPVKGIDLLIHAFTEIKEEFATDWTLTLIGSGPVKIPASKYIHVRDFMTITELAAECRNFGVFCLPSTYEPWGVVVHEFCMAGLPLICSDKVGATDNFIINNYNGLIFESGNKADLKRALLAMMKNSDSELLLMGRRGHKLSKAQSPEIAASSLLSILK